MSGRPICGACGRTHFAKGGGCPARAVRTYPPETPARELVSRGELWAIVDAARVFLRRSQEGRIGATFYVKASETLEVELSALPGDVWRTP